MAASMAAVLLAAGAPGKRFALPHSRIMIHQGSGGFRGSTPDVLIQVKEMETLVKTNHEILSRHTGKTVEEIVADTARDYFMSPPDAKEYGIIDSVYSATRAPASPVPQATDSEDGSDRKAGDGQAPTAEPDKG
jgi:ATP-dependent Clp protease protease subunit